MLYTRWRSSRFACDVVSTDDCISSWKASKLMSLSFRLETLHLSIGGLLIDKEHDTAKWSNGQSCWMVTFVTRQSSVLVMMRSRTQPLCGWVEPHFELNEFGAEVGRNSWSVGSYIHSSVD